jgi:DNA-directed RNA polymerase subunit RPC12/RpoP
MTDDFVRVHCPNCDKRLKLSPHDHQELASTGKGITCPICDVAFTLQPPNVTGKLPTQRTVACPHCQIRIQANPSVFGAPFSCPSCQRELTISKKTGSDKLIVFKGDPNSLKVAAVIACGAEIIGYCIVAAVLGLSPTPGLLWMTILFGAIAATWVGITNFGGIEQ